MWRAELINPVLTKIPINYSLGLNFNLYFTPRKNKQMKRIFLFAVAIVGIITTTTIGSCKSSSKASTSKILKFNLEKGKGYDYEIVWDMNSKISGQETKVSLDGLYSMNVSEDEGHIKSISTSYKRIRMNMQVMGMTIDIDSDKPSLDNGGEGAEKNPLGMMNKVMSGMVGKPFIIKVDEEGKVLEVTGFDKIISDMIDSLGTDEVKKQQVMVSMKDQFSDQTIKDQFAQVFTIFPNKEIKVGDTWEKSYNTGGKMGAKYTTTYKVKEIEGDHVSLTTDTKIGSNGDEMKLKGDQTGNILVDSKTGLMINAEFDQDMEITTMGMKIHMTGKGKIKGKAR